MPRPLSIAATEESGRRVLVLAGELHPSSARELAERVLAEKTPELVLDFSAVAEIEDRALDPLADLVWGSGRRVGLRGLRDRQLRLLQWLGAHRSHPGRDPA